MLDLFPESARIERGELSLGGVTASSSPSASGRRSSSTARRRFAGAVAPRARSKPEGVFYGTKAFRTSRCSPPPRGGHRRRRRVGGELAFARAAGLSGDELVVHGNNKDEELPRGAATEGAPVVLDAPDEAELAAAAGVRASSSA